MASKNNKFVTSAGKITPIATMLPMSCVGNTFTSINVKRNRRNQRNRRSQHIEQVLELPGTKSEKLVGPSVSVAPRLFTKRCVTPGCMNDFDGPVHCIYCHFCTCSRLLYGSDDLSKMPTFEILNKRIVALNQSGFSVYSDTIAIVSLNLPDPIGRGVIPITVYCPLLRTITPEECVPGNPYPLVTGDYFQYRFPTVCYKGKMYADSRVAQISVASKSSLLLKFV